MGWLSTYKYRKKIPITGSAGAGTDYKVPLTVYKDTKEVTVSQIAQSNTDALYSGARIRAGQRLTISSRNIVSLQFYISKSGSPTGDVWFRIRAVDDDEVLNEKLWGGASALQATKTWEEATFDTPVFVNEEVRFCCEYSGGDSSNYLAIQYQNPGVVANENYCVYAVAWFDYDTPPVADYDCAYKYTYYEAESAGTVFLLDYCTDFPNDVRYTDDDGVTELNHDITGSDATLAKFLIEVADDLGSNQDIYIYWGKSGAGSGCSEFREDLSAYSETDPNNHIDDDGDYGVDFDAWGNETAYRYEDKTVAYFGNFEHYIALKSSSVDTNVHAYTWMLTNVVEDGRTLMVGANTGLTLHPVKRVGGAIRMWIEERHSSSTYGDYYDGVDGTQYYLTIKKVGTTFTCKIYSDVTRETLVDTLSLTLQADHSFQYIFCANTHNRGTADNFDTIDIDDFFLRTIIATEPAVGTPGALQSLGLGADYQQITLGVTVY